MDRPIIYTGEIPRSTDVLNGWQQSLIGLGKLIKAILGSNTWVEGLACTPEVPGNLTVQVAPGQIYALDQVDTNGYGVLPANTLEIMKQGLALAAQTLSCPAPTTSGTSINYLIEAAYEDVDANPLVLPYYNAANPSQAFSGPNNSGATQNTIRQGVCNVQMKVGAPAATGSQVTPAVDSGFVGLWVVTVAYGATAIGTGQIAEYAGAPFIPTTLTNAAGLDLPNVFTQPQTIPPAQQVNQAMQLEQFITSTLSRAGAVTYTASQVLPSSVGGQVVFYGAGATAAGMFTLPATSSAYQYTMPIVISNLSAYPLTIAPPTGDTLDSTVTVLQPGQMMAVTNGSASDWRTLWSTAGSTSPVVVGAATANNEAVNLGQVLQVAPQKTSILGSAASTIYATPTIAFTAPCAGYVIAKFTVNQQSPLNNFTSTGWGLFFNSTGYSPSQPNASGEFSEIFSVTAGESISVYSQVTTPGTTSPIELFCETMFLPNP